MVLALGAACSTDPRGPVTDEPSVYAAAVYLLFARDTAPRQVVLVDEVLAVDSSAVEAVIASIPTVNDRDSTTRNFTANSLQFAQIPSVGEIQARTGAMVAIASQATMKRLRAQADSDQQRDPQRFPTHVDPYWHRIHREFAWARTLIRLSPAAYSRDGKHAIMYVAYACGGLCGGGYWVAFDRSGSKWTVRHVRHVRQGFAS